ncbi:MAG TPA: histidine phosphatase family protein [Candidatus Limnocylindrales bacterium]|nr:histidine phosphatase family protein [Candidatus Limnocylindrales bacterium]
MSGAARDAEPAEPALPSPTRLVLARHGETEWSRTGRHTGRTDIPLTDHGREQAERLGRVLRGRTFSRVLSSPLGRALDTCRLAGFADRVELVDGLREWDYGAYEGRTGVEIAVDVPGWTVWSHPIVDGESLVDLGRRADRLIAATLPMGGDVLIFSHGHILRVLAARWIEQPAVIGSRLELATASLSELGWEHDRRVIEGWNATDS